MSYKIGSKGDNVKKIQSFLGLTADGVFGKMTDAAVKKWQKGHNLVSDGIVGPKTWSLMFSSSTKESVSESSSVKVSTNSKCIDSSVVYSPLSVHVTKSSNRPIKYLAIHYTAGGSSKKGRAIACKSVFEKRSASADFAVDDETMVQFNPDLKNYYCWAVGDNKSSKTGGASFNGKAFNKNTISIEVCSNLKKGASASAPNHEGWYFTEESLNNAVKLSKIIMKKYNIPLENVVRHYDITGKLCPGIKGWNDYYLYDSTTGKATSVKNNSDEWKKFKERLK